MKYTITNNNESFYASILNLIPHERNNYLKYSDLVIIDPTYINLENKLTLVPKTFLSQKEHLYLVEYFLVLQLIMIPSISSFFL